MYTGTVEAIATAEPPGTAGTVIDAVCGLISEHGTLHYRVTSRPERITVFTLPDARGNCRSIEVPITEFWDAFRAPDLAVRLGWHEGAGAGSPAAAAFTYRLGCSGGARLTVEDRAWRVPSCGGRRRETHGVLHALDSRRSTAAPADAGLLALRHVLDGGRVEVAFQPVVSAVSGQVGFHECLARFEGPDGRLHAAAEFMPRLEAAGLVTLIDRQVLARAFGTLAEHPACRLSVNIHPRTIGDPEWLAIFDAAARTRPGAADRLIVEITEQGAMEDVAGTREFMDHVRGAGAAFALDDFGEGQTSFGQLREFRFDAVKIAGSFVRGVVDDPDARFFVETLVGVARHFDMMTVAEYVETAAAARILAGLGVDSFQGFYFGRPSLLLAPSESLCPRVAAR